VRELSHATRSDTKHESGFFCRSESGCCFFHDELTIVEFAIVSTAKEAKMLIHDDPNADNSADILSLINDRRILPEGVYYCQRPLYVPNKSIVGEGTELRFPQMKDASYCIAWAGAKNRIMSGISVVGPTQGECLGPTRSDRIYQHGIVVRDCTDCSIHDVTCSNHVCQGFNFSACAGLTISLCTANGTGRDGIFFSRCHDVQLTYCDAYINGDDSIAMWSCAKFLLTCCQIIQRWKPGDDNRMGCGMRIGSGSDITLRNCSIANTVKAGIHLMRDSYATPTGPECDAISIARVQFSDIAKYNGPLWPRQATGQIVTGKSTRVQISQ